MTDLIERQFDKRLSHLVSDGTKIYDYGACTVMMSIDPIITDHLVYSNFGTHHMPKALYKHVSIAHPHRDPTWEEIKTVKELLIGDRFAFQMLPPKKFYINENSHCFHVWAIEEASI